MSEPVPASDVAAAIRHRLPGVGTLKLHKLLYYVQAHHAATFDEPMFAESLSAWDHGPVVGQLWHAEKEIGAVAAREAELTLSERQWNTVGYVLSRYGNLAGADLERLTHSEEPWKRADEARQREGKTSFRIEVSDLIDAFRHEPTDDPLPVDRTELQRLREGAEDREQQPSRPDSREGLLALLRWHRVLGTCCEISRVRSSRGMRSRSRPRTCASRRFGGRSADSTTPTKALSASPNSRTTGAKIPNTSYGDDLAVMCCFWVYERDGVVRCDRFASVPLPW